LLVAAPAASAQEEMLEVSGVAVDVTAENAALAQERALLEGQRRALDMLLRRLAPPEDVARLPPLADAEIGDMVQDFSVESEKASAVRYAGMLSFRFRAAPVRALLEGAGMRFAASAKPVLVLPVLAVGSSSLLWDEANAWRAAWVARRPGSELVPLVVPLGDLDDIGAVDAQQALAGDAARLQSLAARYGAGDALVTVAEVGAEAGSGETVLTVTTHRYGLEGLKDTARDRLALGGETLDALYARAAEQVAAGVQEAWKRQNLVVAGPQRALVVLVPIGGHAEWIELRRRLTGMASLHRSELLALSRREALVNLVYVGDEAQLARALAERDLELVEGGGVWMLGLAGRRPAAGAATP